MTDPTQLVAAAQIISTLNDVATTLAAMSQQLARAGQVVARAQAEGRGILQAEWDEANRLDDASRDALQAAIDRARAEGR